MSDKVLLDQNFLPSSSTMALTRECSGMPAMRQRLHHEGMLLDLDSTAAERGRAGHEGIAGEDYDEETVEQVDVEEANALETSIYRDWLEKVGDEKIGPVVREERLFGHVGLEPIFTAKPDMRVESEDSPVGLVVDHKLGFEEVDPPEANLQIWTQVAAIAMQPRGLEKIWGDVCQPAIHKHPRLTLFDGLFLQTVIQEIKTISLRAIYHPKLHAGIHCGNCPARGGCMTGIAYANKMKLFAEEIVEKVAQIDPVKSDMVYEGLGSAIKILGAVKKLMVVTRRNDPKFLPGYKWINGRRSIDNTPLAIAILQDSGMTRNVLESSLKFTISELDKLIKKHFGLTEEGAKERLGGILAGLIKTADPSLRKKNRNELANG